MRCERTQGLIQASMDRPLGDVEKRLLSEHLAGCPVCVAYAANAPKFQSALDMDARMVASKAYTSAIFDARLHRALQAEAESQAREPIKVLDSLLSRRLSGAGVSARAAQVSLAAALIALALWASSVIVAPPAARPAEFQFHHLAAFSVRTDRQGRVYAALTQHQSVGSPDLEEAGGR